MTTEKTAINAKTGRNVQIWVTVDQYAFMRGFEKFENMSDGEMGRFIFRDFFEARGLQFPADPLPHGDWTREHKVRSKR